MLVAQTPEPDVQTPTPPEPAAQQSAQPQATGTVTGRVFLGDSHLPARLAIVTLLPASRTDARTAKSTASYALVQTGLDGSYVIPNIVPGAYYVVAQDLGYASPVPLDYADPPEFDSAPKEVKEALAALTPIAVSANRSSTAPDIVLNRGAVISGSVRYDDGEPDTQAVVSLVRRDKSGKWAGFKTQEELFSVGSRTDDQGNFRLTGLPAGEYLLKTTLELQGGLEKSGETLSADEASYSWDIYFGDGVRPRDAKTIKLKDGEESNGNTIEIPLARLHSLTGTVISAETSAPVNRATVELHNADDDSTCTVTKINSATGQFRLPYVAEGEYTLKVTSASDVTPGKHDEKPIRTYADASQSIIVKGEMNGITITVKPQPPAGIAAPAVTPATQ
jgi:Carboxypeptidase regulatory-like domain